MDSVEIRRWLEAGGKIRATIRKDREAGRLIEVRRGIGNLCGVNKQLAAAVAAEEARQLEVVMAEAAVRAVREPEYRATRKREATWG